MSLIDIIAICIIMSVGFMGFCGWLDRFRGIIFGLLIGAIIVVVASFAFERVNEVAEFGISTEGSTILRYMDHYAHVFGSNDTFQNIHGR